MKKKIIFSFCLIIYFVVILFVQEFASGSGSVVAKLFSYETVDPDNLFAGIFVHHIIQMAIALLIILLIKMKYKEDFGLKLGDKKTGFFHVMIFSLLFIVFLIVLNLYMYSTIPNIGYNHPLNARNIIGTLAFQMFISGPSEEILFRALPITLFIIIFKKSIKIKWGLSLEVIIAALLFAFAHLDALMIDAQIYYSFALGIAYGIAYQKTKSVLYPMMMHSISNVLSVGIGYLFYFFY